MDFWSQFRRWLRGSWIEIEIATLVKGLLEIMVLPAPLTFRHQMLRGAEALRCFGHAVGHDEFRRLETGSFKVVLTCSWAKCCNFSISSINSFSRAKAALLEFSRSALSASSEILRLCV